MRLVTWNINSLRLRLPLLAQVVAELRPDVICLQETKVPDELFPRDGCRALGFPHLAYRGMKGYNGVAILSRHPICDIRVLDWCGRTDCRHLVGTVSGIEIHCLYVPAGGDIPDPVANPKFAHKLDFLAAVAAMYREQCRDRPAVLAGDLNVAPLETDVWSHKQLVRVVTHTPVEVALIGALQDSFGWQDAVRTFIPPTEKLFSWWSYRSADWTVNDRGRRLDHVWVSAMLSSRLIGASVAREFRGRVLPSDHVPVVVDIDG